MSHQFSPVNAPIMSGDSEDVVSSVVERDSNADTKARRFNATQGLRTSGHLHTGITAKAATFTIDDTHHTVVVSPGSAAVTVNLPAAATVPGKEVTIIKGDTSTNVVTLDASASEQIYASGTNALTYAMGTALATCNTFVCDGAAWWKKS
jgi:hypothetical protein